MSFDVGNVYRTTGGWTAEVVFDDLDDDEVDEDFAPLKVVHERGCTKERVYHHRDGRANISDDDYDLVAEQTDDEAVVASVIGQMKDEPAWKLDGGKPRMDLIAPEFLIGTAAVLRYGADKYAERNWEKGMSWGRCFGALMRHMWAWWGGQKADPETGISHLYHAACCLMFLCAYEERGVGTDDRSALDKTCPPCRE